MTSKRERENQLADFGEVRACRLLQQKGFKVERMPKNFPFFDLMATRNSCRLLVPVKTRNITTSKGKPKTDSYKLYDKRGHHEAAKKIADFARAKIFLGYGDCGFEGKNLFGLHWRCCRTVLTKTYPNASYPPCVRL